VPSRITTTEHRWVAAALVPLDERQARKAVKNGKLGLGTDVPIDYDAPAVMISTLEVYCAECRRPFRDVNGHECEAAESNEHLRGGPIGTRAPRRHDFHDCDAVGCDTSTARRLPQRVGVARGPVRHDLHDCAALGCWDAMQAV
jgi:hypothetical protein